MEVKRLKDTGAGKVLATLKSKLDSKILEHSF